MGVVIELADRTELQTGGFGYQCNLRRPFHGHTRRQYNIWRDISEKSDDITGTDLADLATPVRVLSGTLHIYVKSTKRKVQSQKRLYAG